MQSLNNVTGICAFCLKPTDYDHVDNEHTQEIFLCRNEFCETWNSWMTFVDIDKTNYQLPAAWDVAYWGFNKELRQDNTKRALVILDVLQELSKNGV